MKISSRFLSVLLCLSLSTAALAQPPGANPARSGPDLTGRGDNHALVPSAGRGTGGTPSFDGSPRQRPESATQQSGASSTPLLVIVIVLCALGGAALLFLKNKPSIQR